MQNVLYITFGENLSVESSGVCKKIYSQVDAIANSGFNVYLSGFFNERYLINGLDDGIDLINQSSFFKRKKVFKYLLEKIIFLKVKIVYVRMISASPYLIDFYKKLNELNVKIILEIPTYPYDQEVIGFKSRILNLIDKIYRSKYENLVDWVVTFSSDEFIYNVKCINISNAIDVKDLLDFEEIINKEDINLKFLSVSSIAYWHGIDRFIKSMVDYYKKGECKYNIEFYIVGPSNDIRKRLEKYVSSEPLIRNKVFFLGEKKSDELRDIYLNMDCGVGSLGRHRSGIYELNSLKNKEYCCFGLPFVYSENDKDFDGESFAFKVSPDENNLNIEDLCIQLVNLNLNRSEISKFAYNFTWDIQMKKIFSNF